MDNRYQPLDCDLHDYLEIACMRGYRLQVELLDGPGFSATALTTRTAPSKEEFLVFDLHGERREVRLDQLQAITALTPGASFTRLELAARVCAI